MALFRGTKEQAVSAPEGEAAVECVKAGQFLVENGHLSAENLASSLAAANGDLLHFADTVMSRFTVGRTEVALALTAATGVQAVATKNIVIADEVKGALPEALVRKQCAIGVAIEGNALVVLCADPSPSRRAAIEAAANRPVNYFIADPVTVRT